MGFGVVLGIGISKLGTGGRDLPRSILGDVVVAGADGTGRPALRRRKASRGPTRSRPRPSPRFSSPRLGGPRVRPGWSSPSELTPTARAPAPRATGVVPDDRPMEAPLDPLRPVRGRRPLRLDDDRHGPGLARDRRHPGQSQGRAQGKAIRQGEARLPAGPEARRPERLAPRGNGRPLRGVVSRGTAGEAGRAEGALPRLAELLGQHQQEAARAEAADARRGDSPG